MAESAVCAEESLLARQRKETKDLRGKIQALKKSIPKGDKKRKREVTAEIAQLEKTLQEKHDEELETLKSQDPIPPDQESTFHSGEDRLEEDLQTLKVDDNESELEDKSTKKSRARKRQERKAKQELERGQRIAEDEAELATDNPRLVERERLASILQPLGLVVRDIPPDGHCLYAAFSDQLSVKLGIKVDVSELRKQCADYIRTNSPAFLPFLTDSTTGEQLTQAEFDRYCTDIADTANWGGQLEIRALSSVYKVLVQVFQAEAPALCVGEATERSTILTLSYHLKEYGLGEHYNSVVALAS